MIEGMVPLNPDRMALLIETDDPVRLQHAVALMAAATALEWGVTVVLLGPALRRYVEGRLDEGLPAPGARPEPTSQLWDEAASLGRLTVLACSADARAAGYRRADLAGKLDAVMGMPTILLRIREAGTRLFI